MNMTGTLPSELAAQMGAELRPGERIDWVGQPIPARLARKGIAIVLFGLPFTAFALFWMYGASGGFSRHSGFPDDGGFTRIFPLFGLIPLLAGLGMLTSPYWLLRKARRTVYAVTDRRALVIEGRIFGGITVRSFEPGELADRRRVQHADGTGDLILERQWRTQNEVRRGSPEVGFLAIADVKQVDDLLQLLIARSQRVSP